MGGRLTKYGHCLEAGPPRGAGGGRRLKPSKLGIVAWPGVCCEVQSLPSIWPELPCGDRVWEGIP